MDQIKQTKAGSALEKLICLHVYEHQLEGGDKEKERAKFRAEIPADKRTSRAVLYSPILRAVFKAINATMEGEWTPGDDAAPEIKAMAAILKAQGIAGLLAEEPAVAPSIGLPPSLATSAPIPLAVAPPPTGPFAVSLPPLGTPFALPPLPGLGG
jgi:hypothetical protein